MSIDDEERKFTNRITIISDQRLSIAELTAAVEKFGEVTQVSSRRYDWDD